jgi:hypothetical protein
MGRVGWDLADIDFLIESFDFKDAAARISLIRVKSGFPAKMVSNLSYLNHLFGV